jgi:putative ABC transport system permease protein
MFSNQFKLIWRRLLKDRQFTILNLLGLSTGLACAFLIYLWVSDELHVDTFHQNNAHLYQVLANEKNADGASILLLTIATISFQSLKAAFSNPVDRLRSE